MEALTFFMGVVCVLTGVMCVIGVALAVALMAYPKG